MKPLRIVPALLACLVATACVTINVYFPAVAAERAADRIIDDVWGKQPPPAAPQPQSHSERALPERLTLAAMRSLELIIPAAQAQQADLDITSPAIRRITESMEDRHARLKPLYDSGAIGLTRDGLVELRDMNAVPLASRNQARKLVADENADRNALYREIAVANKQPDWEKDIRRTFARRWVDRAPKGWWYQDAKGEWQQK